MRVGHNPYAAGPHTWVYTLPRTHESVTDLNLNPPWTLVVFAPLSRLPIESAFRLWITVNSLFFIVGWLLLLRQPLTIWQAAWLTISPLALHALLLDQLYGLLFLVAAVACVSLVRGDRTSCYMLSGVMIAAKPFLLLWPGYLALTRRYREAWTALGSAAVVFLSAWPIYGWGLYSQWRLALAQDIHWRMEFNISVVSILSRMGYPRLGILLALLLVVATATAAILRRLNETALAILAASVGMIMQPIGWAHYALFLAPWFVAQRWNRVSYAAAILLTLCVPISFVVGWLGPVTALGGTLLVIWGTVDPLPAIALTLGRIRQPTP